MTASDLNTTLNELLRPARFTNTVLWVTLTVSIGIYVAVAWMVASQRAAPRPLDPTLELSITIAAFLLAAGSVLVPRVLLSDDRIRAFLASQTSLREIARNQKYRLVDEVVMAQVEALPERERKLVSLPALYFTPFILRLVLNEAVAIMGLVLSMLAGRVEPLLPFAIAAIVLNVLSFPRLEPFIERARLLDATSGGAL